MYDDGEDTTPSPQRVVRDPEDFAQMERLRQIYAAREDFRETLAEIDRIAREQELTRLNQKYRYLQRSYLKYYFELEGLMREHRDGDFYLDDAFLGILAEPQEEPYLRERMGEINKTTLDDNDRAQQLRGELEEKEGVRVFFGLESLTGFPAPIKTAGYTIDRHAEKKNRPVQVSVPKSVIVQAYRFCNRFLADVGLDADITEETPDAGFKYSDLLDDDAGTDAPEMVGDGGQHE